MSAATEHARATEGSAGLHAFNALPDDEARTRVLACLGVPRFADVVVGGRPYADLDALLSTAEDAADDLTDDELAAALAGHPRIGERATSAAHQAEFSAREQSGVDPDDAQVATELTDGNRAYEERFDRVFLIRAAGRTAGEILGELRRRLGNDDAAERAETVTQLREIALLRLTEVAA
ncbi:2-oxo-4-hydroxy-4-carboxy-5-ureidoimidazoline decarboxylase [Terracoccus luteus]|uniref:2-oxo-4-hydroxy-4-carboxy-5-ureidoimidazoline decarboxylase n=1 Tax=Terracoccus luteus TaxID=53356 RepID=UPI000EB4D57E|nr:2-oxo-4-hydroxy-4-carboxy-5-ureidoimidazoline decarboxylase [Terracoccus luteus]